MVVDTSVFHNLLRKNPKNPKSFTLTKEKLKNNFFKLFFFTQFSRKLLWISSGLFYKIAYKMGVSNLWINSKDLYLGLLILKNQSELKFNILVDIFVCDHPGQFNRFTVTYHLLSPINNTRLQLSTNLNELNALCSSVSLFKSSNWLEREIWDMYGIIFSYHPDLRRILTDYGFSGYPLRKDFPLSGFLEVWYAYTFGQLVYTSVELMQAYRTFKFQSPWVNQVLR